jgi:hypothetical protein
MRHDLIIDFETFSQEPIDCAVIDCSAIVFSWEKMTSNEPYTLKDITNVKRFKLSVKEQIDVYSYKTEERTVKFWQNQPQDIIDLIKPKKSDLTVSEFVKDFHNFLIDSPKIEYWWSRANTFEPIIIRRLFESQKKGLHLDEYLKYWRVRDIRTFVDAKFNFSTKNAFTPIQDEELWKAVVKEHSSRWDVIADLLRMQAIVRAENDLEMVKK